MFPLDEAAKQPDFLAVVNEKYMTFFSL